MHATLRGLSSQLGESERKGAHDAMACSWAERLLHEPGLLTRFPSPCQLVHTHPETSLQQIAGIRGRALSAPVGDPVCALPCIVGVVYTQDTVSRKTFTHPCGDSSVVGGRSHSPLSTNREGMNQGLVP